MPVNAAIAGRDTDAGLDQRAPLVDDRAVLEQHDADLDDAVVRRETAGGLEVDARHRAAQRFGAQRQCGSGIGSQVSRRSARPA